MEASLPEKALDTFQKMKRQRIAFIVSELLRRGGEADKREFMGSIATNYGIRRRTQEEYLEDLKYAGVIDVRANTIVLLWETEKAEEWLKKQR